MINLATAERVRRGRTRWSAAAAGCAGRHLGQRRTGGGRRPHGGQSDRPARYWLLNDIPSRRCRRAGCDVHIHSGVGLGTGVVLVEPGTDRDRSREKTLHVDSTTFIVDAQGVATWISAINARAFGDPRHVQRRERPAVGDSVGDRTEHQLHAATGADEDSARSGHMRARARCRRGVAVRPRGARHTAFLDLHVYDATDGTVGVVGGFGIGAPAAVATMESSTLSSRP
jgi:hypothetical protein